MSIVHDTRPAGTPAYYLGRTAAVWMTALQRSHRVAGPRGRISTKGTTLDHRAASCPGAMAEVA